MFNEDSNFVSSEEKTAPETKTDAESPGKTTKKKSTSKKKGTSRKKNASKPKADSIENILRLEIHSMKTNDAIDYLLAVGIAAKKIYLELKKENT